jgi:plastocyanin
VKFTHRLFRRSAFPQYWGMLTLLALVAGCTVNEPGSEPDGVTFQAAESIRVGSGKLMIRPSKVTAEVNQKVQFVAYVPGSKRDIKADMVTWSVTGGTITSSGLFTASGKGTFKVTARAGGRIKSDTSVVQVLGTQPTLTAVVIDPDSVAVAVGASLTFTAHGLLTDSASTDVGVEWTATGGEIDAGGGYRAGSVPGGYRAIARNPSSGLADTAAVVVLSVDTAPPQPTLQALLLSPASVSLDAGQSKQFVTQARFSDGSTGDVAVTYRATGGTIDNSGLYTAGRSAGTYRVIAETLGLADSAVVTIAAASGGGSCSGSATVICPGEDARAKASAAGPGATLTFRAGLHRFVSIAAQNNQVFRGEPGAVLTGARLLTDWVQDGSRWYVGGQSQNNTNHATRTCLPEYPGCNLPEQLWIDGALQVRVTSLGAVGPGSWYLDTGTDRAYIGSDPRGREVETSVTPQAFSGSATGVRIVGLTIERYATGSGTGTIDAKSGWTVDSVDVGYSNGTCIRVSGSNVRVRWGRAHHCGEQGIGGPAGPGLLVYGNEISYNNTAGFGPGGGDNKAAGLKVSHTTDMVIRRNNVHHNHGIGLWCDISCVRSVYDSNTVEDNDRRGIQHEISYGCTIGYNVVRRNGAKESGAAAAGIWIAQSSDCEIHHNTVEDNKSGIVGTDRDRGSGSLGPYLLENMYVHHNTVRQSSGLAGGVQDQHPNHDPYSAAANNRWVSNTYTTTSPSFLWTGNSTLSKSQWEAAGQD